MEDLFISKPSEYVRDINPMKNYVDVASFYLGKLSGDDPAITREWLMTQINNKNEKVLAQMPQIKFLLREDDEDRRVEYTTLDKYIGHIINTDRIMAPTGTVYKQPKEQLSLFTPYINTNRNMRKVFKMKMLDAKRVGDSDDADFNNEQQSNVKIDVNTLSGTALTPSTIVHTASVHPSLTSTGRVGTSIANAVNEKLIRGNRHYENPHTVLDNITVMAYKADRFRIGQCVLDWGLKVPTPSDIIDMIRESSSNYWRNKKWMRKFYDFLTTCDESERCNIMYNGSLWDIIQHNPEFARVFIDDLSEPATESLPVEQAEKIINSTYGDLRILGIYLCFEHTKGKSLEKCRDEDHYTYGLVAATIAKIEANLIKYEPILLAFFKLDVLPGNIFNIKSMYRKAVVTSDTDSTNFTCQEVCKFMTGDYGITDKDRKVTFLITYLSSMMVCQAFGLVSTNMGVKEENIRELSMKNEYYIPIHCLTPSAKNYIMVQGGQEGNMLPEVELVTKGVELRSSKIPEAVLKRFDTYKRDVFLTLERGGSLNVADVVSLPATIEHKMLESLTQGNTEYLFNIYIKNADAYSREEDAAQWKYHLMYEAIFAPKYGHVTDIPYTAFTVKIDLGTKTKLTKWLNNLDDAEMRQRALDHFEANPLTGINAMTFPSSLFFGKKLPAEIIDVIMVKPLVMMVMGPWYLLFESFGIYLKNKHNSRMISNVFSGYINPDLLEAKDEGV